MEGLLVLAILIALAIPVLIIVLLVGQSNLRARLEKVERALRETRATVAALAQTAREASDAAPPAVAAKTPAAKKAAAAVIANRQDAAAVTAQPPSQPPSQIVSPYELAKSETADLAARAQAADRAANLAGRLQEADQSIGVPAMQDTQNRPLVMRTDRVGDLVKWLLVNWVYAVSALSLALAGVFFVQYGMEKGLLPPGLRVIFALVFGACLIGGGEWLRRKVGDGEDKSTAYLPSVFAGAGIVTMFAAILAARQMYGLIGPGMAFAGQVATAVLAIGLGWIYGPLLVAVGLLGAALAPFVVAGGTAAEPWLYGYFVVVTAVGLAVDAVRRWAWVSVLALVLGYGTGWASLAAGAGVPGWIAMSVTLAIMAVILPLLSVVPRHAGPSVVQALRAHSAVGWPIFPVRLAAGAALASSLALLLLVQSSPSEAMLALAALTLLALAYLIWADRAEGLDDLALVPAVGFLASLVLHGLGQLPVWRDYVAQAAINRAAEAAAPMTVTWILAMAVALSAAAALRSLRAGPWRIAYGLGAVLVAPVAVAILDLLWQPAAVIGPYPWALHAMAIAAAMVVLAQRYARLDGDDHRRFAYATLSALSLIGLSLFVLTTAVGLTLALGVLVVVAAGLDRKFRLPEMGYFIQLATAVLGYRLLADPGVFWALEAPLGQVILAFGGVIVALIAAYWLIRPLDRLLPKGVLESAIVGFAAIFANVLISRWLDIGNGYNVESHWGVTLNAMPWLVLMLMQLYRARLGGPLLRLRQAIAVVAGGLAAAGLAVAAVPQNPLFTYDPADVEGLVRGPYILDSLLLAYGVPGVLLLLAAWKMPGLGRLRFGFIAVGAALAALYAGLEIRRCWQGDWIGELAGVKQGELYTYTLALMLLGAVLLYQAIAAKSVLLRRIAMGVIAITVAKVFLLDASGLTGLTRVISFAGLGLSLAGLAWLNRWAGQVSEK